MNKANGGEKNVQDQERPRKQRYHSPGKGVGLSDVVHARSSHPPAPEPIKIDRSKSIADQIAEVAKQKGWNVGGRNG